MIKKRPSALVILFLITLFAFGQRIYQINTNPPALNWDEVSHGYNAYSILKTNRDEWGIKFPLIFKAFGDFKLPLYIYLTTLPIALLGLTPLTVRLISVLAGTLAIPGIYFLTQELLKNKNSLNDNPNNTFSLPLISAFLLSVLPWHFFISRPALEANLALTLIIFASVFLLKALTNQKYYLPSAILFSLSLHAYNTARVFVPLIVLFFILIYKPKIKLNLSFIISLLIFFASLSLVGYQVFQGTGTARYQKLTILTPTAVFQIGQDRLSSPLPPLVARLIHNRPVYFLTKFTKNYLSYFSYSFLYQTQGVQKQFAIPNKNLLSFPITFLVLTGFIALIIKRKTYSKSFAFLISFLLLSPIAAAFTNDPPQALRPNPLIPVLIIFASLGFNFILTWFKKPTIKKIIASALVLTIILSFISYLNSYYSTYRQNYSSSWQYGYQQVNQYLKTHQQDYSQVIFTKYYGEPHIFYAFYQQLDPQILQPQEDNLRFFQSDWYWTDRLNNIYFVNDWDIPQDLKEFIPLESGGQVPISGSLLVLSPNNLPKNIKILDTIYFLNNSQAFIIAVKN